MAKVGIVMGSDSDMPVMAKAADILEQLGISYEMTIIRHTENRMYFLNMQRQQKKRDLRSLLQGAGMAAHLPGMCAAIFPMPVIWYSNAHHFFRRQGFSLFDCTDAKRYSGCNRSH